VKVWGLTNGLRGPDSEDVDEERLDTVESEGSRGDEEVEDGEKHRRTTGGSPSRTFFFPRNGWRFPPADGQPHLLLLPFTLDVSGGGR
jgi:hypothetical protein